MITNMPGSSIAINLLKKTLKGPRKLYTNIYFDRDLGNAMCFQVSWTEPTFYNIFVVEVTKNLPDSK